MRYHLCWGSWHGPHTHDLAFEHIIDLMLEVNAQCYSFEAANVRHEHEWTLWKTIKLPDGKIILPGVVSHATNLIEHPGAGGRAHPALCQPASAARTSSPAPTAASAAACMQIWPGRSSARWPRARGSPHSGFGAEPVSGTSASGPCQADNAPGSPARTGSAWNCRATAPWCVRRPAAGGHNSRCKICSRN